jgi:hypothetical protein
MELSQTTAIESSAKSDSFGENLPEREQRTTNQTGKLSYARNSNNLIEFRRNC